MSIVPAPLVRWPAAVVVLLILGALAAGTLFAGAQPSTRDPEQMLTQRAIVDPFIGLPPEGAAPSSPETGQLVLSVYGRLNITEDVHGVWLYADGRLIWRRSLDRHLGLSSEARRHGFGASESTRAVIEQRLTAVGIELLRSEIVGAGLSSLKSDRECGGPVYWARLAVRVGDQLMRGGWCDPELPGRLVVFASWRPPSAWADQRIGGYVPSWYAVCIDPKGQQARVMERIPEAIRSLIESGAAPIYQPDPRPACAYQVTTDNAHAMAEMLDGAGLERSYFDSDRLLGYTIPLDHGAGDSFVGFVPILPNGELVEYRQ